MKNWEWLQQGSEEYKDTETLFQKAYDEGNEDLQWKCINRVCLAIVKKLLKGVKRPEDEVYEMALDATIKVIETMKNKGTRPLKLTSFCYYPCLGIVHHPKKKFNDLLYSLDFIQEKCGDAYLEYLGENEDEEE